MDKKGQGISVNVIIVAAIALIVLVVLVAIFTGRINVFDRDVDIASREFCTESAAVAESQAEGLQGNRAYRSAGGQWFSASTGCPAGNQEVFGNFFDKEPGRVCCTPVQA